MVPLRNINLKLKINLKLFLMGAWNFLTSTHVEKKLPQQSSHYTSNMAY